MGLVFAIFFICLLTVDDCRTAALYKCSQLQIQYNRALDQAAEDAMFHLVESDSGRAVIINELEAAEQFFTSLYINLGIMENAYLKSQIKFYVPFISIIDKDGFMIYCHNEGNNGDMAFTEKYSYQWEDWRYVVQFTMSDIVSVFDKAADKTLTGNYNDIREIFPCKALEAARFDEIRRITIVESLVDKFSRYFTEYNRIARKYGISYEFQLPLIDKADWYRTIDDISLIAFFQGYPYGNGIEGYYNRVSLSGARLNKKGV